jgi:glycosyltransferase involved in cell wall biosynthesis
MFPQLSETFVANEVLALERMGVPLKLYSYRLPRAAVPHDCVRQIREPVHYLPDPLGAHPGRLLRAHPLLLRLDPIRYGSTVRWVARNTLRVRKPDTWRRFLQAAYLAAHAQRAGVRHFHAHFAHGATRVAMIASRLTGIPFSFTAHAYDIYTAKPSYLRRKIQAAQYVVTCTRSNQTYLRELVEPKDRDKIEVVYHGADLAKFSPGDESRAESRPLLLGVGRLVPKKGFSALLDACRVLLDREHQFRCLIVGEGPERAALEAHAAALGLGEVVSLPGARSQEELVELYRRATVLALPSRVLANGDRDGIPNVLVEAMAAGVPVVATAVSGIPELIEHGETGWLLEHPHGGDLADALETLLLDPARRGQLAKGARATVERHFDARRNVRALARMLPEAVVRTAA